MKTKIVIKVEALKNACAAKLIKSESEFVNFSITSDEVGKLVNWGIIHKSDNSTNEKVIYLGELNYDMEEKQ
jgi:hypothetical protein